MRIVSERSQELLMKLVAWECFGSKEIEPKTLLREVPLADLSAVSSNIQEQASFRNYVCTSMVELELLHKTGKLRNDWSYTKEGEKVSLHYEPTDFGVELSSSMALSFLLETPMKEYYA